MIILEIIVCLLKNLKVNNRFINIKQHKILDKFQDKRQQKSMINYNSNMKNSKTLILLKQILLGLTFYQRDMLWNKF